MFIICWTCVLCIAYCFLFVDFISYCVQIVHNRKVVLIFNIYISKKCFSLIVDQTSM